MKINNKYDQRKDCEKKRSVIKKNNLQAPKKLENILKNSNIFQNSKIVASFISIKSEISTENLNDFILKSNKILCLPAIPDDKEILTFRKYELNSNLVIGKYGIKEPNKSLSDLYPDLILTPCLAFDLNGFRLGYGGGYYDKTFSFLKKHNYPFISVAVAFDDQKVQEVIHDQNDQKINFILTEKYLYKV